MSTPQVRSITPDKINELLKEKRTRGDYDAVLKNFFESGEPGIEVPLDSGPFVGKKASQVKVGLDNARKRVDSTTGQPIHPGGHAVKVAKEGNAEKGEEEHVYLIDTSKVMGEAPEE